MVLPWLSSKYFPYVTYIPGQGDFAQMDDILDKRQTAPYSLLHKADTMKPHLADYYLSCHYAFTSFDKSILKPS